jgi:hypothetical protein
MGLLTKILAWLHPASEKEAQDDADRRNFDNETVKTSALGAPPMMQGQKPWNNP